jgi:RNA-directed DNA polymerase
MKIIDLTNKQAKAFLLKEKSYAYFDLPPYFRFSVILNKVSKKLSGKKLSDFFNSRKKPYNFEGVNYTLLGNKNGKYDWRPLQLIHPAIYVSLVNTICGKNNWKLIVGRFTEFEKNNYVECKSLPRVSTDNKSDVATQVSAWWRDIEKNSVIASLDFDYAFHTDITNCYGSIYTHSIPWALHTKPGAKKNRSGALVGNIIDKHLTYMSYGQTNGIPQGSVLMDFIAEMVLGYADEILTEKLKNAGLKKSAFRILRYRDDYRIFSNRPELIDDICKYLTETLIELGMKINTNKSVFSDQIVTSSIKEDKRYWLENGKKGTSIPERIQLVHSLAMKYPNSGTLISELSKIQKELFVSKKIKSDVMITISYVVDIAYRNPRSYALSMAIVSKLLESTTAKIKKEVAKKIHVKFSKVPNTGMLDIWLQRALVHSSYEIENKENICKLVNGENVSLWESGWLKASMSNLIREVDIFDQEEYATLEPTIDAKEVQLFGY